LDFHHYKDLAAGLEEMVVATVEVVEIQEEILETVEIQEIVVMQEIVVQEDQMMELDTEDRDQELEEMIQDQWVE
jgi:hypothetical protein